MEKEKSILRHESPIRRVIAEKNNEEYRSVKSLEEARKNNALLIMEGDYGGQIYLSCPVKLIKCDGKTIQSLLMKLDKLAWNDPDGAKVYYEIMRTDSIISGGMDGGVAKKGLWIHPQFSKLKKEILAILQAKEE